MAILPYNTRQQFQHEPGDTNEIELSNIWDQEKQPDGKIKVSFDIDSSNETEYFYWFIEGASIAEFYGINDFAILSPEKVEGKTEAEILDYITENQLFEK